MINFFPHLRNLLNHLKFYTVVVNHHLHRRHRHLLHHHHRRLHHHHHRIRHHYRHRLPPRFCLSPPEDLRESPQAKK
jgi:hypothetical protein